MGAYRFERIPAVKGSDDNSIEFDSSADRAIGQKYGYHPGSVELRQTQDTTTHTFYDVYARANYGSGDPAPLLKRGELICMKREEIWRRQAVGNSHERAFPPTRESVERKRNEFHLKPERV